VLLAMHATAWRCRLGLLSLGFWARNGIYPSDFYGSHLPIRYVRHRTDRTGLCDYTLSKVSARHVGKALWASSRRSGNA